MPQTIKEEPVLQEEVDRENVDYIEVIKQMKENTVDKELYLKLKDENKRLLQSLVNGETISAEESMPVDIKQLRADLYGSDNDYSNLEYMTKTMKLRDAILEKGGPDPFLPYGKNITPTQEDEDTAKRVAEIIKECIDYADGDSSVFTNELQRRMIDTSPQKRQKNK